MLNNIAIVVDFILKNHVGTAEMLTSTEEISLPQLSVWPYVTLSML
jgi:hypothetical protein